MSIIGLRDTSGFTTDLRPKNYREGLLLLYRHGVESKAPLTALTSLMKKRTTDDPEFNWWEKEVSNRRFRLHATTGDLSTSNTTVKLVTDTASSDYHSAKELKEGDVLYVEQTGELIRVNQDPTSDTQFIVQRGFAGSTAAAVDPDGSGINPYAIVIGSAYEEGSLAPTGVHRDPVKKFNYTQIFRQTIEFTRTAMKTRLRSKADVAEAKREALEMMSMDMERGFFLGRRFEGTHNGKPIRHMGGLLNFMDSDHIVDEVPATGTDMATLEDYLKLIFMYGSSEKLAFCGDDALLTIQRIVRRNSSMQIESGITEFGMKVMRLYSPFGTLVLKRHPLFTDMAGGTNTTAFYGGSSWLWAIDAAHLKYVHLDGSDIKYQADLQANGLDGEKSGYLGEVSIEISNAKAHTLIRKLSASKLDGTGVI